ncbi:MAG TPA: hypothetical protein DHU72_02185 [Rikenellaceae bacterium]|nr:hypothetical protein [Rikenellaceae bacterium]
MKGRKGNIGCFLLRCLTRPLAILPLSFHRACGKVIGRATGSLARYRRDVVMTNLARSFPDKKYEELENICHRAYEHFGKLITETIWFGAGNFRDRIFKSHIVEITNPELINGLHDKGKSIFALASHSGNWELIGGYDHYSYQEPLKFDEKDICVVYRAMSSHAWDKFMRLNRIAALKDKKHYDGMVETYSVLRYAIRNKDRQILYNFITDQHPYSPTSCVHVKDFLHQPTLSMDGAAALAHKFGAAAVYLGMKENPDGNYSITYTLIAEDSSKMSVKEILDRYYELLENDIQEQPWNYLWTHKRWK